MKNLKLIVLASTLFIGLTCNAQNNNMENIEDVIIKFATAADESNSENLAKCLDDNYRVVMNRLFGSESVSILSKSIYLEKIKSKEFGGDTREISIESITINGTTANAKVVFKGTKITFVSLLSLIQNSDGQWKLISDTPIVE